MQLTWLDNGSWLIELAGTRILLDPWLVGPFQFGSGGGWFFRADRNQPRAIPENIDLILLSQGLPDHAHPPTLKALDRGIPVVGSPKAAELARRLGYQNVTALSDGETHQPVAGSDLRITAITGSPEGLRAMGNAYILRDERTGLSLYHEPHGVHRDSLAERAPVDVVLSPALNVRTAFGSRLEGEQLALKAARLLKPRYLLPTGAGGDLTYSGLLTRLLREDDQPSQLGDRLAAEGLPTRVLQPQPWEALTIEPAAASVG